MRNNQVINQISSKAPKVTIKQSHTYLKFKLKSNSFKAAKQSKPQKSN